MSAFTSTLVAIALGAGCSRAADPKQQTAADAPAAEILARHQRTFGDAFAAPHVGAARTPTKVRTPSLANDRVEVEDDASHVAVAFALRGAAPVAKHEVDGTVVYPAAFAGADVLQRVRADGVEDYVVFDAKPVTEELAYDVDVSRVAGLRKIGNAVEMLDASGAPRLRIAPPRAIDAEGRWHDAALSLQACAFDTSPAAPWGRPVTPPGASQCTVRVRWQIAKYPAAIDPAWTSTGSMVHVRARHYGVLLSTGRALIGGGEDTQGNWTSFTELYDPATKTFGYSGNQSGPRGTAVLLGSGKVLVTRASVPSAEVYDPSTGAFTTTAGAMQTRRDSTSTLLGNNTVLLAGGTDSTGATLSSAEIYNPATDTFASTGALSGARALHTATLLPSGLVLVAGGTNGGALATSELYDPTGGAFSAGPAMRVHRAQHAAVALQSGKVLLVGGYDENAAATASAETYDANANAFTATNNLAQARRYPVATRLSTGRVLVTGFFSTGQLGEVFEPTTGSFLSARNTLVARTQHSATLLGTGSVLLAGGVGESSAELYEPIVAGGYCIEHGECGSGQCENGVCCAAACAGPCRACAVGTGACVPVVNTTDNDCNGTNTCDPLGACKKAVGQACGGNAECANGQCVDGYCCNAPCNGSCQVCSIAMGALVNGACAPAPVGSSGRPACGNGYACNGQGASCPVACTGDVDCLSTHYCAANGTCQPRKANGGSCNLSAGMDCLVGNCRECNSNHCVDGVCCDTACNGLCQACTASLKQSGAQDGTCGSAKAQTNPHNDACPTAPPSTCGADGKCDGNGGCAPYYPAGTSCGASVCDTNANAAAGQLCNGAGTCAPTPNGVPCGDFRCKNGSCPNACTGDADCIATAYCNQGTCQPKQANGKPCGGANACSSTQCVDGVCCNSACDGECEACGASGACGPITGSPQGKRPRCAAPEAGNPCSGPLCDGANRTSCALYPGAETACRKASCANNTSTAAASCDGLGHCPDPISTDCGALVCDVALGVCKSSCVTDADCTGGAKCAEGKCTTGATCSDSHTAVDVAGNAIPCEPYMCSGGACRTSCATVEDCVAPAVCDPSGKCVDGPKPTPSDGGGCSAAPGGSTRGGLPILLSALGAALVLRRRRAARASRLELAAAAVALFALPSCSRHADSSARLDGADASTAISTQSAWATARTAELRERFPVIFSERRATRAESSVVVSLPVTADGQLAIEDRASRVATRVTLVGARAAERNDAEGASLFRAALGASDVMLRERPGGAEDFVVFESKPEREELVYEIDVTRVAGVRLIDATLELLDASGAPRLRMLAPLVTDATNHVHSARVALEGCAYDASPAAPWGRAVIAPGAGTCRMRVSWSSPTYPAVVDPAWVSTGLMTATRREHAASLLASGRVLVAGGFSATSSTVLTSAEIYDRTTNTFAATGSMSTPRYRFTSTLLGSGKVLVAGGEGAFGAQLYDPGTGAFSAAGSMVVGNRADHTATLLPSGRVLLIGGYVATAEIYDPGTDTFTATGSMASDRHGHAAHLVGAKVVVIGGALAGTGAPVGVAELYDIAAGTFSTTGTMVYPRAAFASAVLGTGGVLVAGGTAQSADVRTRVELYDPQAGTFTGLANMFHTHDSARASTTPTGKVLVVGSSGAAVSGGDLFDPTTNTFSDGGGAAQRRFPTATLLGTGEVLVAGGDNQSAELFALVAAGGSCNTGLDCVSGVCLDQVCCAGACAGSCRTCAVGTGACTLVQNKEDGRTCVGSYICDANAACKLKTGQTCSVASLCASGNCSDGYCCDSACSGACDVCAASLGASANGACTLSPLGADGNPTCGNNLACNHVSAACPVACATDADCLTTHYCAPNGTCQTRKTNGQACNLAAGADCKATGCRECASGNCVDGVCCDTACTGTCQACLAALKQSGAQDGVCGNAKAHTNPHNDNCPVSAPSTCGSDGKCDGNGACSLHYPAGTSCGPSVCNAGNASASGQLCDGNGTCAASGAPVACGDFVCRNGSCLGTCTGDADCAATAYCNSGACLARQVNGKPCGGASACTSGHCIDGVCCTGECNGQCETCDAAGACVPATGQPKGKRTACPVAAPGDVCGGPVCDGATRATCAAYPGSSVTCRAASCDGVSAIQAASCDGAGHCPAPVPTDCGSYACDPASGQCKSSCTTDGDCARGTHCKQGQCASDATCKDDHTLVDVGGQETPCDPYECADGACKTSCASLADCAAPNVCDPSGKCVPDARGGGGGDSGCGASGRSTGAGSSVALVGFVALAVALRRRRRGATR